MALPETIASGANAAIGYNPPHKLGSNYYQLVATTTGIVCYKASSLGAAGWSAQDNTNRPSSASSITVLSSISSSTEIHMTYVVSDVVYYSRFDSSGDTWEVTDISVNNTASSSRQPTVHHALIEIRTATNELVIAFRGGGDNVMGNIADRCMFMTADVAVTTAGGWSGPTDLDSSGTFQETLAATGLSTDGTAVHVLMGRQTGSTRIAVANTSTAVTIASDDTLGTLQGPDTQDAGVGSHGHGNVYSNSVYWPARDAAGSSLIYQSGTEDVNDELSAISGATSTTTSAVRAISGNLTALSTAIDSTSGDLYVLYSGGGTAGVDNDIYYTSYDGTWASVTEHTDAVTCDAIHADQIETGSITFTYVNSSGDYIIDQITLASVENKSTTSTSTTSGVAVAVATAPGAATAAATTSGAHVAAATAPGAITAAATTSGVHTGVATAVGAVSGAAVTDGAITGVGTAVGAAVGSATTDGTHVNTATAPGAMSGAAVVSGLSVASPTVEVSTSSTAVISGVTTGDSTSVTEVAATSSFTVSSTHASDETVEVSASIAAVIQGIAAGVNPSAGRSVVFTTYQAQGNRERVAVSKIPLDVEADYKNAR